MADLTLSVTVKRKIAKYAEGATPGVDEPYEISEAEVVLSGQEAYDALEQMGVSKEAAIEIARQQQNSGE